MILCKRLGHKITLSELKSSAALMILSFLATSFATAQVPNIPAGRFHHSGVSRHFVGFDRAT